MREILTLTGRVLAIHNEEPLALVQVPFFHQTETCFIRNDGYLIGQLITFGVDDVLTDPRRIDRKAATRT